MGSNPSPPNINWYENDGIVNTISMDGPHGEKIIKYAGKSTSGVWQHIDIIDFDHHQILLREINKANKDKILNIYINHCRLLYQL